MRRTLIFVTVLLVLLGIIFFTEKYKEEISQSVVTENSILLPKFLFAEKISDIVGLNIVTENGILELERDDFGLWVVIQPEGADVQPGIVEAAVSQLRALPLLAEDLPLSSSDVGVREQAIQVSVSFADGAESAFRVGDFTPSGSGYYIQSADGQIGILDRDALDTFLNVLKHFSFS